ncbi:MAG: hypothetical protein H6728_12715 [Myxococcales bacterium]|nr:hypothetical protein [Myxococcales bacterium]MCB9643930.1 hypothetical protein [Myxococcales bacterium]
MDFMRCDAMVRRLSEIVDGEASCGERFGFYFHMSICWKCRRYMRQFKQMRTLTGQVQVEELPDDFAEVMSRVLQSEAEGATQHSESLLRSEGMLIGQPVWIKK